MVTPASPDATIANRTPAPRPAETLAELIDDLTQGLSAVEPEQAQPVLDVDSTSEPVEAAVLEQLDRLLAPPDSHDDSPGTNSRWFLGLDIGTTGISAVLLDQATCLLYPLYWQTAETTGFVAKKKFRLSTAVALSTSEPTASPLPTIRPAPTDLPGLHLSHWKPYLRIAVPHHSPQTLQWEPVLQWSETQTVPLRTLQEVLQQQLATLNPDKAAFMPALTCGAVGLEPEALQVILQNLGGIVVGYPHNWSDTYGFNVREAILQAELVQHPDQIVLIEESIATILSALPATDGRTVMLSQAQAGQGHLHNANWQGITLILTAGASLTELVLVNLPPALATLNHTDFYVRSLPYAGQSIDQDIICQLIRPALLNDALPAAQATYDFALEPLNPAELDWADLPHAAELDVAKRTQLQRRLESSRLGQPLSTAAQALKITLQHQSRFTLKYGSHCISFNRQDLTSRVLLPYVQRLNRELNTLLAQTNTTVAAVKQVICTGGTASLGAIARWLRQKLPNATIIQDTYPRPTAEDDCIPSCSRVAYGLATLPLHPQVVDQPRHQASDYFLLLSLLRYLPQKSLRVETIMELLEQQGIDTQSSRFRILALLDGHLPPGLVPVEADRELLTPASRSNPDYQAVQLAPLFTKPADRTYEPNRAQWDYLQQYLETLLADTEQTLSQPLQPLTALFAQPSD